MCVFTPWCFAVRCSISVNSRQCNLACCSWQKAFSVILCAFDVKRPSSSDETVPLSQQPLVTSPAVAYFLSHFFLHQNCHVMEMWSCCYLVSADVCGFGRSTLTGRTTITLPVSQSLQDSIPGVWQHICPLISVYCPLGPFPDLHCLLASSAGSCCSLFLRPCPPPGSWCSWEQHKGFPPWFTLSAMELQPWT